MSFCCPSYQVQRVQYTKWSVILYCGKQIYIVQLLSWDEVWLCHHASVSKACYHKDVLVFITLFAKNFDNKPIHMHRTSFTSDL